MKWTVQWSRNASNKEQSGKRWLDFVEHNYALSDNTAQAILSDDRSITFQDCILIISCGGISMKLLYPQIQNEKNFLFH